MDSSQKPDSTAGDTTVDQDLSLVVEDVIRRRSAGEDVSDQAIIQDHAELMPELAQRLDALRLVERAELQARPPIPTAIDWPPWCPAQIDGYQPVEQLRHDAAAVTFRGVHVTTQQEVAIKLFRVNWSASPSPKGRYDYVRWLLPTLERTSIAPVLDAGIFSEGYYFVREYGLGQPLDDFVQTQHLAVRELLQLFQDICKALDAAHRQGLSHGRLKPSNVQIDTLGRPIILDFALVSIAPDQPSAQGHLRWMCPEQLMDKPLPLGPCSDVYTLGLMLFHALTEQFPYYVLGSREEVKDNILHAQPVRPSSIVPQLDGELDAIVLQCLKKDPQQRYPTAGELGREIERYLGNEVIAAKCNETGYLLRKVAARNKVAAVATAVVLLAVIVLAFIALTGG